MIIYRDFVTGDELFSDSYKMRLVDDVFYEVDGKMVTEKTEVTDDMIGGNASAEGGEDEGGAEATSQSGCDIVLANRLVETGFTKKDYQTYIKDYMKKIIERLKKENPDRVDAFKAAATAAVKKILSSYKDWQFFTGESMNPDGMAALMNFREDGMTPYMLFFKDGLIEEKV